MEEIRDLSNEIHGSVNYICSAELYDCLFRYVRSKLLEGWSYQKIQTELEKLNAGDVNSEMYKVFLSKE